MFSYFSYIVFIIYVWNNFGKYVAQASREKTCREVEHGMLYCNYIPLLIPDGIFEVHLIDVYNTDLRNTTFLKRGWNQIKYLELTLDGTGNVTLHENCFDGLYRLQTLKFSTPLKLLMHPDSFGKLDTVEILDLSECSRLYFDEFVQAINGSNKLPRLRKLNLSRCDKYYKPIPNSDAITEALETKNISFLDLSGLQFGLFDVTSVVKKLRYLKTLNISYAKIGNTYREPVQQNDLKHLENIDVSFIALPEKIFPSIPGRFTISGINISLLNFGKYEKLQLMFAPRSINATGISGQLSSYWFKNITITLDKPLKFLTKSLILRRNNLRHLDVRFNCDKYKVLSLEYLDISENEMDFIHPSVLSCIPNVQYIDLSKNVLSIMAKQNSSLFETLFSSSRFLKHINLSNNKLDTIPKKMFTNNRNVKTIDLSYNMLDQVHFDLTGLNNLEVLNLKGNNIHILDKVSISSLNGILYRNDSNVSISDLILKSNPLSCSKCEDKNFISWLLSTKLVNLTSQELKCYNEDEVLDHVTTHTRYKIQKICQREMIVIVTSVLAGVIALTIIVGSIVLYMKLKRKRILQNRENVLNLLQKGEDHFKFAVFLAFSNDDEYFVNQYILHQLDENLQLMTGLDRELVCTGDRHYRPGFYVHNEGFRALDMAAVVIVAASNNFCKSSYCKNELDQAYVKKKPIVLMLIESIDPEVMVPTMRELFQRNVRILWTLQDGEYKMKTTWENVCTSILDLIEV